MAAFAASNLLGDFYLHILKPTLHIKIFPSLFVFGNVKITFWAKLQRCWPGVPQIFTHTLGPIRMHQHTKQHHSSKMTDKKGKAGEVQCGKLIGHGVKGRKVSLKPRTIGDGRELQHHLIYSSCHNVGLWADRCTLLPAQSEIILTDSKVVGLAKHVKVRHNKGSLFGW